MEDSKIFNVYSFRLMRYLDGKGFKFVGTKQCEEDRDRTIFRYEDSEELREEVRRYTEHWKNVFKEGK